MTNLINHFRPQIVSIIADKFSQGYTARELTEPLSNRLWWWQDDLYSTEKLHCDSAEMTVQGWCNAVELITGSDLAFLEELRLCYTGVIMAGEAERAYLVEQDAMQEQLKLNYEVNEHIERVGA